VKKTHIWGLVGFVAGTLFGAKVLSLIKSL
jgi:hypothetical protein